MDQAWTPRPKPDQPERLERRLEFDDYATTRDFLERLNALCEEQQRFPDISFGRTYVNLTVRAEAEEALIAEPEWAFAAAIDALIA
ncbi:4a-hydroxytetrahydrobiopterin dehydratase [Cyanobium sp. FACHB-13342]|uniref:4a-hydroxytetrahydrobiopterin dehydratase n=1 Tax=Cyanobium sp. FACHB-13342 TaxID=2692793 RepID=UPI001680C4E9|nr:4a-hydroxytetrahydrobiopterin dehydratase [Cyanobium sp. FACHB-13342]MBD2421957.1 4a-hydroxytetrahydrobiopterin dehydratase [Cyanobium sp. FACHB-13342]